MLPEVRSASQRFCNCEFQAHGRGFSLIRASTSGVTLPRGKKLGILVRLTNHNILENREFVANSQRFAERSGTARRSRNHKGRGVGEPEDWSGVLARSGKSMGSKRPALLLEKPSPTGTQWRKSRCTEGRK